MSYAANDAGRDRQGTHAAIFIDYENLHHELNKKVRDRGEAGTLISEMIEALKRSLSEERQTRTAVSWAYADFTTLNGEGDAVQRALYLQGVESRFVPRSLQANAVEIQLCVDAMDLLHHRPDIDFFVLLTGRRSYLPLVQHVKRYGRRVLVVALEEPIALDQVQHLDGEWFFDARDLLSTAGHRHLSPADRTAPQQSSNGSAGTSGPATADRTTKRARFRAIDDPILIRSLEIIEEYFGHYEEVYLTPLLRKMSDLLDERTCDPKAIVSDLEDHVAVRLEKRQGFPHDYTVLIVERDHPDVERVQQEVSDRTSVDDDDWYGSDGGPTDEYDRSPGENDPSGGEIRRRMTADDVDEYDDAGVNENDADDYDESEYDPDNDTYDDY